MSFIIGSNRIQYLDDPMQRDNICASSQVLQDFDLPLDLLLLHRLQRLHHALLVVVDVDRLKHLGVFSPPQLPHKLIVILRNQIQLRFSQRLPTLHWAVFEDDAWKSAMICTI